MLRIEQSSITTDSEVEAAWHVDDRDTGPTSSGRPVSGGQSRPIDFLVAVTKCKDVKVAGEFLPILRLERPLCSTHRISVEPRVPTNTRCQR